jgi:hypothetical protein
MNIKLEVTSESDIFFFYENKYEWGYLELITGLVLMKRDIKVYRKSKSYKRNSLSLVKYWPKCLITVANHSQSKIRFMSSYY